MNGLAALAGVPPSTAHARRGGREIDMRTSTLQKLANAQLAEELRLLNYLLSLHGVPEALKEAS